MEEKRKDWKPLYELVDEYIQLIETLDIQAEMGVEITESDNNRLEELETIFLERLENIHYIFLRKDEKMNMLSARIATYADELARLKKKLQSNKNAKIRLDDLVIRTINEIGTPNKTGNMTLETDVNKYTVVKGDGPIEIINSLDIPDSYMKATWTIDKAKLKAFIKKDGNTDYAKVPKIERLRIS